MFRWKVVMTAFLAVFFLGLCALHASPSLTGLINSDFKAGKISFNDAIIYKALMAQTPWVLPKKYQPKGPIRDTTPVILEVLAELKNAHPEVQNYVYYIFAPPKARDQMAIPTLDSVSLARKDIPILSLSEYSDKTKEEYLTPEGHFIIHYSTKGKNACTPEYAEEVGTYLEQSWSHEVDTLGYDAPELGNNGRLDVYILDIGEIYGSANPGDSDTEGYININKDYSWVGDNDDPSGKAVGALKVTAAHEFFHHIQFGYLNNSIDPGEMWWIESSATFMEDEVFNEVNDYHLYLDTFFDNTHVAINDIGDGYETVLINKLLKEHFNGGSPDVVKEILEKLVTFTNAEEAIEDILEQKGHSLEVCIRDFALWNFFTSSRYRAGYYEEGSEYPDFHNFQSTNTIGISTPSTGEQTGEIDNLAANYYQIKPDPGMTETKSISVQVARNSEKVVGRIVVCKTNGDVEVHDVVFDSENKAEVFVDDFNVTHIEEVVLILSNGDKNATKNVAYSVSIVKGLDLIFVIDTTGSMWDDIANVKASAAEMVNLIDSDLADYRIAVVDYRDFPVYPYGGSGDYPYHVDLPFSSDKGSIISALQGLTLGWGADWRESVYSALIRSINSEGLTPWRDNVDKCIILLGDAPPHDPEPFTGYTLDSVVAAAGSLFTISNVVANSTESGDQVMIYSIVIGWDYTTYSYFSSLSEQTGGKVFKALTASEVVDKIMEAIGAIEEPGDNNPPICSGAVASISEIWPPNHKMEAVQILNVEDPDGDPVFIKITDITQDEPVSGSGKGDKSPDGEGIGTNTAWVRAERDGNGNGRVYKISFIAYDDKGAECYGSVLVGVPHDQGINTICIDDGQSYDSTASMAIK